MTLSRLLTGAALLALVACNSRPAPASGSSSEIGELVASASRKMMHDDGAGCIADLERIARIDPALFKRLALYTAQCEMLVGKCQSGKSRIATFYREEMNFSRERAEQMAESMGSMRCRGGDSTARDDLLRALFELSDGAYMNPKDSSFCRTRVETVRRLAPKVRPRDPEDTQVLSGPKALFHTAAMCFARAADCDSAWKAYRDNYPTEGLSAVKDPEQREEVIKTSFRSTIERCKQAI